MLQDQHRRVSILYADAFFDAGDMAKRGEFTPWDGEAVASLRNGWGCVIIPDQARPEEGYMMRGEIPHDIVRAFSETRAYIYFLEALAQIIPVLVAGEYLNQYYISFVDNEAAKHALVRGYGSVTAVNQLIQTFWSECENRQLHPWFERVSSAANLADAVSRDDLTEGLRRGWKTISPDMNEMYNMLRRIPYPDVPPILPDARDSGDQVKIGGSQTDPDGTNENPDGTREGQTAGDGATMGPTSGPPKRAAARPGPAPY
jgi:hypothetical protein